MPKKPRDTDYNPGEFGYRTRGNRTGLDPVENQMEYGRAQGLFLRSLLRGNIQTNNPSCLVLMAIFAGVLLCVAAQLLFTTDDPMPLLVCVSLLSLGFVISFLSNLGTGTERRKHRHRDNFED